jgi:L-seryl-tRNA(Ser) seleniumtransferase
MGDNPYRQLPSVTDLLAAVQPRLEAGVYSTAQIVPAIREVLTDARRGLRDGRPLDREAVIDQVLSRLERRYRPKLVRVINATGIVLHTNLGRAPMANEAAEAAGLAASGYVNLEMDLESGKRSSRQDVVREWLCRLTGAESATVVNNNAAATVIVLRAVAKGREVVLSRGQLIEIGGSFRIPEIMAVSGAVLREVGTTNITRLRDYENAIGPETAALLQVHTSNYRVVGFTESVALEDLVALGRKHGLPVIDDIGSGALIDFAPYGFTGEPVARKSIEAGADLVLFSGDKLLGGPQAGIIAGGKRWIDVIERDPLMRAFRLDKMTLAALEATLRLYLREDRVAESVPVLRLLSTPLDELRRRAESLAGRLSQLGGIASARAVEDVAMVGGGSLPEQPMPTWVVEVTAKERSEQELAHALRSGREAVLGRVRDGVLVLDVRTVFEDQEAALIRAVSNASEKGRSP